MSEQFGKNFGNSNYPWLWIGFQSFAKLIKKEKLRAEISRAEPWYCYQIFDKMTNELIIETGNGGEAYYKETKWTNSSTKPLTLSLTGAAESCKMGAHTIEKTPLVL